MNSVLVRDRFARNVFGPAFVLRIAVLMLACNYCQAQDESELRNLIFEAVALSAAKDSPRPLGGRSPGETQQLLESLDGYLAAITPLRGSRSTRPELIEQLGLVAGAYQQLGRHDEALSIFDEAIELARDEGGRNSLTQIPLLEQKVPSYLALDDIGSIDETRERIYELVDRRFGAGDRELYYATLSLADWHFAAYFRQNFGPGGGGLQHQRSFIPRNPRAVNGVGPSNDGFIDDFDADVDGPRAGSIEAIFRGDIKDVSGLDITDPRLRRIDRLFNDYQQEIQRSGRAELGIVVDIAKRIARLAYVTKQEMDFERDHPVFVLDYEGSREQAARNSPWRMEESYKSGRTALNYVITALRSVDGVRPEALTSALLDLGDWHLCYGKVKAAVKAYAEAYQVLLDAGYSTSVVEAALANDSPPRIPVFATHMHTRGSTGVDPNAELRYRGFIDVRYTVDSLGNAGNIEYLGGTVADASVIENLLELQLDSQKFRPVLSQVSLDAPGMVETRFYYSY